MKSPITGKEMVLQLEKRTLVFRKEEFGYHHRSFLCRDSGESYTTTALAEFNLKQVYNQYRTKHNLPFPDEVRSLRKSYGLSAGMMARILGFGINSYRNYEQGEVPSMANANLIQLVSQGTDNFKMLVDLSRELTQREKTKIYKRIHSAKERHGELEIERKYEEALFKGRPPDAQSGYRRPRLGKMVQMIVFFVGPLKPTENMVGNLMFYADFLHYGKTAHSLSGARYGAHDLGPVPLRFNGLLDYAEAQGLVRIVIDDAPHGIGKCLHKLDGREFRSEFFDPVELETLNHVLERFKGYSSEKIREMSQEERVWMANEKQKGIMDYNGSFELVHV